MSRTIPWWATGLWGCIGGASGTTDNFNNVYGPATPYSNNGSVGSASANDKAADPQFVGGPNPTTAEGFRPGPGSPLCGAGTPVDRGMNDFIGINFASIPAIGAIECGVPKVQMTDQNRLRLQ